MTAPTLILIDIQEGFRDAAWAQRSNPEFEAQVRLLLATWRKAGRPLIHVRHDSQEPASPLRPGQPGHAFMSCAQPEAGEPVIGKTVHSAFLGTDLAQRLEAAGTTTVVLAGLATDHCVSTTARMAADLGFTVLLVDDATAAKPRTDPRGGLIDAAAVHRAALASLHHEFATVLTVDELFAPQGEALMSPKHLSLTAAAALTACTVGDPPRFATTQDSVAAATGITWVGERTSLSGDGTLAVGAPLPQVELTDTQMHASALGARGRVKVIDTLPSIDTPVCIQQTQVLGETAALDARVERITISADLPYAQRRFRDEAGLGNVEFYSEYRDGAFGKATGLRVDRNGLLARAVMVVDGDGVVRHLQVVPEITQMPDMERAFAVANALVASP